MAPQPPADAVACSSGRAGDAEVAMCGAGCADLFSRHITAVCGRCRCQLCMECLPPSAPPRLYAPARAPSRTAAFADAGCVFDYAMLLSWTNGFKAEIGMTAGCKLCRVLVDFGRAAAVTVLTAYGASSELVGTRTVLTPGRARFGFVGRGAPSRQPVLMCYMASPPLMPPPLPAAPPPPPPPPHPPSPHRPAHHRSPRPSPSPPFVPLAAAPQQHRSAVDDLGGAPAYVSACRAQDHTSHRMAGWPTAWRMIDCPHYPLTGDRHAPRMLGR